jgi:hypothetical protein
MPLFGDAESFASGSCWIVWMVGECCCGEFDGVGVDLGVCVGVEVGRDAAVVVVGLQCEEPASPVVRDGGWGGWPRRKAGKLRLAGALSRRGLMRADLGLHAERDRW